MLKRICNDLLNRKILIKKLIKFIEKNKIYLIIYIKSSIGITRIPKTVTIEPKKKKKEVIEEIH